MKNVTDKIQATMVCKSLLAVGVAVLLVVINVYSETVGDHGRDYLSRLAATLDLAQIHTAWIKYNISHGTGDREEVAILLSGQRFYRRTSRESGGKATVTFEWSDGKVIVSGGSLSNSSTFLIRAFEPGFREQCLGFLTHVYNYRDRNATLYSSLIPTDLNPAARSGELSYVSKATKWKLVYTPTGSDLTLPENIVPARITSTLPNGKMAAEWQFDGWKVREGGVWLPDRGTVLQFFENLPETGQGNEQDIYTIEEAKFNIPIAEAWFMPQFPEGTQVEDFISDSVLIIPKFDFRSDPTEYISIPKTPPKPSP